MSVPRAERDLILWPFVLVEFYALTVYGAVRKFDILVIFPS